MPINGQRILVVIPTDDVGGAERILQLLAKQFAMAGAMVDVVVLARGNRGGWSGLPLQIRLHFVAAQSVVVGALLAMPLLRRLSRPSGFLLALASHTHCNGYLSVLRQLHVLVVGTLVVRESTSIADRFRGIKRRLIRGIYRYCYGGVDVVICQTSRMKEALLSFVPALQRLQVLVVPNPTDWQKIRKLATSSGEVVLPQLYAVAVGRLIPVKGFAVLLQAYASIPPANRVFSLVLIGDGPERQALESSASALGIGDRVVFVGHARNPYPYMAGAAFGVLSSHIEGFPNVVLEMIALGKRVVATDCAGDLRSLPNVQICLPGDVGALASAMQSMAKSDSVAMLPIQEFLDSRTPEAFCERIIGLLEGRSGVRCLNGEIQA